MMTRRKFIVPAAKYRLERGGLIVSKSLSSMIEDYSRATGITSANENDIVAWYRTKGWTVKKGRI